MASIYNYTSGVALAPGSDAWLTAMTDLGYQVSPEMPTFVLNGYPPVYIDPEPDRGPPVSPAPGSGGSSSAPGGSGSSPIPSASRVPPPGTTGLPNSGMPTSTVNPPATQWTSWIPDLSPFADVAGRIKNATLDNLGAVYEGIQTVVGRLSGTVRDLAQAVLPTIEELATAVAATATGALNFLADNLTDMADFGATLASALIEPLYALLDAGGEKFQAWLLGLLRALVAALRGVTGPVSAQVSAFARTI